MAVKRNVFTGLSKQQVYRFVNGRRKHNERRRRAADARRRQLLILITSGRFKPKDVSALAAELGVERTTVWRDLKAIEADRPDAPGRCLHCGQRLNPQDLDGLAS